MGKDVRNESKYIDYPYYSFILAKELTHRSTDGDYDGANNRTKKKTS